MILAIPFYQRAVELDPKFALSYRFLSVSYMNLGQATRASQNAKTAFELRERVSEREKYAIEDVYYAEVTGELEKAKQVNELWKQSYSRDHPLPFRNLGDCFMKLGQWETARREHEESLRLNRIPGRTTLIWLLRNWRSIERMRPRRRLSKRWHARWIHISCGLHFIR